MKYKIKTSRGNKLTKHYLFIFFFASSASQSLLAFLLSPGKGDELLDRVPDRKCGSGLGIPNDACPDGKDALLLARLRPADGEDGCGVLLRARVRLAGPSVEVTVPVVERVSEEWGIKGPGGLLSDTGVRADAAGSLSAVSTDELEGMTVGLPNAGGVPSKTGERIDAAGSLSAFLTGVVKGMTVVVGGGGATMTVMLSKAGGLPSNTGVRVGAAGSPSAVSTGGIEGVEIGGGFPDK